MWQYSLRTKWWISFSQWWGLHLMSQIKLNTVRKWIIRPGEKNYPASATTSIWIGLEFYCSSKRSLKVHFPNEISASFCLALLLIPISIAFSQAGRQQNSHSQTGHKDTSPNWRFSPLLPLLTQLCGFTAVFLSGQGTFEVSLCQETSLHLKPLLNDGFQQVSSVRVSLQQALNDSGN